MACRNPALAKLAGADAFGRTPGAHRAHTGRTPGANPGAYPGANPGANITPILDITKRANATQQKALDLIKAIQWSTERAPLILAKRLNQLGNSDFWCGNFSLEALLGGLIEQRDALEVEAEADFAVDAQIHAVVCYRRQQLTRRL